MSGKVGGEVSGLALRCFKSARDHEAEKRRAFLALFRLESGSRAMGADEVTMNPSRASLGSLMHRD